MVNPSYIRAVLFVCVLNIHFERMAAAGISLPYDLQDWCPYTKFCNLEPNQTVPANNVLGKEMMLCCETCSCAHDCGLNRKCCTDDLDDHAIDETLNTVCKQLVTKEIEDTDEHYFHMVDKCLNVMEKCNERRDYHPVFSRTTHTIYYNEWCAKCHNQTDIRTFVAIVESSSDHGSYSKIITDTIFGTSKDLNSFVRFIPSREANLHDHLCYPNTVRQCKADSIHFEQFNSLCQSFNATYHDSIRTYANVYCYICSYKDKPLDEILEIVSRNGLCDSTLSNVYNPRSTGSFTILLDSNTDRLVDASNGIFDDNGPVWCEDNQSYIKINCRRIYCPEGQYRFHGNCGYLGDTWFASRVSVLVKLTPIARIGNDEVTEISGVDQGVSVGDLLETPMMFINWALNLLYKTTEDGGYVDHFVADLRRHIYIPFDPKPFLNNIKEALKKSWKITIGDMSYMLKAELDTNLKYMAYDSDRTFIPNWLDNYRYHWRINGSTFTVQDSEILRAISINLVHEYGVGNMIFTRMFFCDQVELLPHEYTVERDVIYLKRKAVYMGYGSFVRVTTGNHTVYRVCLSDLRYDGSNSAGNKAFCGWLFIQIGLVSLFVYKIFI